MGLHVSENNYKKKPEDKGLKTELILNKQQKTKRIIEPSHDTDEGRGQMSMANIIRVGTRDLRLQLGTYENRVTKG